MTKKRKVLKNDQDVRNREVELTADVVKQLKKKLPNIFESIAKEYQK